MSACGGAARPDMTDDTAWGARGLAMTDILSLGRSGPGQALGRHLSGRLSVRAGALPSCVLMSNHVLGASVSPIPNQKRPIISILLQRSLWEFTVFPGTLLRKDLGFAVSSHIVTSLRAQPRSPAVQCHHNLAFLDLQWNCCSGQ